MTRRTFGNSRKLKSGRWQARYSHPETRETHNSPTTYATKAEANLWLAETEVELHKSIWHDPAKGKVTLRGFSATWIEGRRLTPGPEKTMRGC